MTEKKDITKLCLSPAAAAAAIGTTRSNLYKYICSGELKSFTLGRLRKIRVSDLEDFVDRMAESVNE